MTAPIPHPLHEDCHKVSRIPRAHRREVEHAGRHAAADGPAASTTSNGYGSISQQMLTRTLRGLERDGMGDPGPSFSDSPPQVEYSLD